MQDVQGVQVEQGLCVWRGGGGHSSASAQCRVSKAGRQMEAVQRQHNQQASLRDTRGVPGICVEFRRQQACAQQLFEEQ
jgi:hypothetical protein